MDTSLVVRDTLVNRIIFLLFLLLGSKAVKAGSIPYFVDSISYQSYEQAPSGNFFKIPSR